VGGAKRNVADKVSFIINETSRAFRKDNIGEEDIIYVEDDFYNQDLLLYDVA